MRPLTIGRSLRRLTSYRDAQRPRGLLGLHRRPAMALDRVSLQLYRSLVRLARTFDANPALKVGLSGEGGRPLPGRPAAAFVSAAAAASQLAQSPHCRP